MPNKPDIDALIDALVQSRRAAANSPPPALANLSDLLGPGLPLPPAPVIRARWFKGETIPVDGYTFERCRFDGCHLMTEMATFTFRDCVIAPDSGLYFTGPALKVARLLMHTLRAKGRIVMVGGEEAVFASVKPDGTFTLE